MNKDFSLQVRGNKTQTAETPRSIRDFGLLKVRSMKVKQSEAVVFREDSKRVTNFANMSNDRLVQIVQGTDLAEIRRLSKWFAQTNGMYNRAVRYIADILLFDFMIYPNLPLDIELDEKMNKTILKGFNEVLEHFDNSSIQLMCRKWANQICLEGCFYGYVCDDINDKLVIQDLPTDWCRSRFMHRGKPIIEFNAQYFDKVTSNDEVRKQVLLLFPKEIQEGYRKYKNGKLPAEGDDSMAGWFMLDLNRAFKFNFYDSDLPPFANAIPAFLALGETQDLQMEKLIQEIQKILVQRFELDKNGQIPFTMPELQRLNQNAIDMVGDAVGVSVLSTIANVELEDLSNNANQSSSAVEAAEGTVYNELGISMNLFNTEGNLALEKSILNDEAYVKQLMLQFEHFFNDYLSWKFNTKKISFRMKMLKTSIFNFTTLSDKYKDLTKLGFSRFLPLAALGHTQKEITSLSKLEQQIMELDNWMLPPFSSNTMSSDTWSDIKTIQQTGGIRRQSEAAKAASSVGASEGGRPTLAADQKSEKTIANQESM